MVAAFDDAQSQVGLGRSAWAGQRLILGLRSALLVASLGVALSVLGVGIISADGQMAEVSDMPNVEEEESNDTREYVARGYPIYDLLARADLQAVQYFIAGEAEIWSTACFPDHRFASWVEDVRYDIPEDIVAVIQDTIGNPLDWVNNGGDRNSIYVVGGIMWIRADEMIHDQCAEYLENLRALRLRTYRVSLIAGDDGDGVMIASTVTMADQMTHMRVQGEGIIDLMVRISPSEDGAIVGGFIRARNSELAMEYLGRTGEDTPLILGLDESLRFTLRIEPLDE